MLKLLTQKARFNKVNNMLGTTLKKGSLVLCDEEHCYTCYTQFVKYHSKYAVRFAYKCYPVKNETYRVIGIYNHVMEDFWDDNEFVIVVESVKNRQLFLMGELGLKEANHTTQKKTKTVLNEEAKN